MSAEKKKKRFCATWDARLRTAVDDGAEPGRFVDAQRFIDAQLQIVQSALEQVTGPWRMLEHVEGNQGRIDVEALYRDAPWEFVKALFRQLWAWLEGLGARPVPTFADAGVPVFAIEDVLNGRTGCAVEEWARPHWSGATPQRVAAERPLHQKFLSLPQILEVLAAGGHPPTLAVNLGANDGACVSRELGGRGPLHMADELNCLAARGLPTIIVEGDDAHFPALRARFPAEALVLERVAAPTLVDTLLGARAALDEKYGGDEWRRDAEIDVLKVDLDGDDCAMLEAVLAWTKPLVVYMEVSVLTRLVPPEIAIRQRGPEGPRGAGVLPDDPFSLIGCSVGAMLTLLPGYRLLQIEQPQFDAVFVRADVAPLFAFARHTPAEVWRRYVWCDALTLLRFTLAGSRVCDQRLFAADLPLDARAVLVERCLALDMRARGVRTNYTVALAPL